jgi:MFS family permease
LSSIDPTLSPVAPPVLVRPAISWRKNVILLLGDTAFFFFAMSLLDQSSVLPALIEHFTSEPVFIGLVGSAQTAFWLLPQLLVARIVAGRRRKLPIVLASTTAGRLSWLILLVALLLPGPPGPTFLLVAAYVSMSLFWLMDGFSVLAWYDLIARAVPSTLRGRMFGMMALSGIFGVAGGFVVDRVLGNPAFPFPADYRILLTIALIAFLLGAIPLYLVREPLPEEHPPPTEPMVSYLRRLPRLVQDRPAFRRVLAIQLLIGTASLAIPFYAPFGVQVLGVSESNVGTFIIGITAGSMLGGFAWGYLGDHGRKELAIVAVSAIAALAPFTALLLGRFVQLLPSGAFVPILTFALFCVGCANRSSWLAYANYVMEIAEAQERPVLIGLMNTLSGPLAIMPPLGGLLAGWFGYDATFVASMIPALLSVVLGLGLRRA